MPVTFIGELAGHFFFTFSIIKLLTKLLSIIYIKK
jgi:hypothetical protein